MKIEITGKHMDVRKDVTSWAKKKFSKLKKFFKNEAVLKLTFTPQKHGKFTRVEATIIYKGMVFRAEVESDDQLNAIDRAVAIIERQIRKNKTKLEKRFYEGAFDNFNNHENVIEENQYKIVKSKKFAIKPMSEEEAVLQMELIGHEFFVFLNGDTEEVNVVYKRKDGNYGLIEPQI